MTDSNNIPDLADLEGDFQSTKTDWKPEDKPFDDTPVPNGKYQVRVERAEVTKSQNGNPMLKWQLVIMNGEHARRKLFRQNMLVTGKNFEWLLSDLHICEVELDKLTNLPNKASELLDLMLEVTVRNGRDSNGQPTQNVYLNKKIGKWTSEDAGPVEDIPF